MSDQFGEENPQALKHLFGSALLKRIAGAIGEVYSAFDRKRFVGLMPELENLEMKARVRFLRAELRCGLPEDYTQALQILLASIRGGALKGFDLWPYSDFVQTYGLEDLNISLNALKELTPLFSSEFAVRPFLKRYPVQTLQFLTQCARAQEVDLRRWASEGARPRLPWGERLHDFVRDPSPTLRILELLRFDPELYVRKSVANHLNDIAKDHPERVIQVLNRWQKAAADEDAMTRIQWVILRALRTKIKEGHLGALRLIGVSSHAKIKVSKLQLNQNSFKMGERIAFELSIRSLSAKPQKLLVDYIIHFVKANQRTLPKVFKLKTVTLPAGGELVIGKGHPLKKVTTRSHYPGLHLLEVQVNGRVVARAKWELSG